MEHTDSIRITYHPDSLCEFYNFQNDNSKIFYYYYENKNCKSDKNTQINQIFSWHFLSPLLLISSLLFLIYIFISLHATIIPFSHRPYTLSANYKDVFPLSTKFLFFFFLWLCSLRHREINWRKYLGDVCDWKVKWD